MDDGHQFAIGMATLQLLVLSHPVLQEADFSLVDFLVNSDAFHDADKGVD